MFHPGISKRQTEWIKPPLRGHSIVLSTRALSPAPGAKRIVAFIQLKLTAKGKRTFSQIEENALAWERELVRNIKLTELNRLYAILDKIDANLDRLDET